MPRVRKEFKLAHVNHDNHGNSMLLYHEPVYGNYKLALRLNGDLKEKNIGEIDANRKILIVKRVRKSHYFYKMSSYGFNYALMHGDAPVPFNSVLLKEIDADGVSYFMIPVAIIRSMGVVKEFSGIGFERQIFLKYSAILNYRCNARFENDRLAHFEMR